MHMKKLSGQDPQQPGNILLKVSIPGKLPPKADPRMDKETVAVSVKPPHNKELKRRIQHIDYTYPESIGIKTCKI